MTNSNNNNIKCSFCGKTQNAVQRIVVGPGVYICDECIKECIFVMNVLRYVIIF